MRTGTSRANRHHEFGLYRGAEGQLSEPERGAHWVIIGDGVPAERYGGVSGMAQALASVASIIAPVLTGAMVAQAHSWALMFTVGAVIAVVGALALAFFGAVRTDSSAEPRKPLEESPAGEPR